MMTSKMLIQEKELTDSEYQTKLEYQLEKVVLAFETLLIDLACRHTSDHFPSLHGNLQNESISYQI